jgi:dTDP-4-amino-4,6-dideoxygalactose transaminase
MGAKIAGYQAGIFGDISFFSFNRGKNLPTYKGGCIITISKELSDNLGKAMADSMEKQNIFFEFLLPLKILAISLATKPFIYGLIYPIISLFKDIAPPKDIKVKGLSSFQASLGVLLLNRREVFFEKRYQNGMFLTSGLKDLEGIKVALIPADLQPAFNRFPLVFRDLMKKEKVEKKFKEAGIETSRMYLKPLHHMFDLGYRKEEFPNACYFAEHLLTLPVHPLVRQEDLQRMINIIRDTVN